MMKYMPALNLIVGSAFVIPAVMQGDEGLKGLEAALAASRAALDGMTQIRRDLTDGDLSAVERLMNTTEGSILDGTERDVRLRALRQEVNQLQTTLDTIEAGGEESILVHTPELTLRAGPQGLQLHGADGSPLPTAGLDEATRNLLRSTMSGPKTERTTNAEPLPRRRKLETKSDYSASRLREGRLLYKSEKYQDALNVLQNLSEDEVGDGWEAKYWTARTLEKLEREEDAILLYEEILQDENGAGGFGQLARKDYDFLVWKREFFQRRNKRLEGE